MIQERNFISIVVSAFNEAENIPELYKQIQAALALCPTIKTELIFVNDGSTDTTLEVLKNLLQSDQRVRIVNLIRNFGHEIAMTAGMDFANGQAVLFMDADLQHPPMLIPQLVEQWQKGNDIVMTRRVDNLEQNNFQKLKGKIFYKLLNAMSDFYIPPQAPDFRLIDSKYVDVLKRMKENNRMFRGMISWIGCPNQVVIDFFAPKRFAGKSKYSFRRLMGLAVDSVVSFSIKPLRIATYIGIITALISVCLGIYFTFDFLTSKTYQFTGYGTTIVMVIFLGSVQLIVLGIMGEYLGRIHLEVKNRPLYVADYLIHEPAR